MPKNLPNTKSQSKVYSIHKLMGYDNPLFIPNMVKLFIKSAEEFIDKISLAIQEEDLDKINRLAHRIKPAVDAMEVCSIADSIREFENTQTLDDILVSKIEETITELKKIIEVMRKDFA